MRATRMETRRVGSAPAKYADSRTDFNTGITRQAIRKVERIRIIRPNVSIGVIPFRREGDCGDYLAVFLSCS